MTTEAWVEFRGVRFTAPFICMCCGVETSAEQWAFGRTCAPCDTGACQPGNRSFDQQFAHDEPAWLPHRYDGKGFDRFVRALRAEAGD